MAKKLEKIEIKFKSAVKQDADGDKTYTYDYVSADLKCTRRYNSVMCLLMGITGCAIHLMEWLAGNMNEGGYVHNNAITRKAFSEFHFKHKKNKAKSYGDDAINKAFRQLSDVDFLVSTIKGVYRINPMYFFIEDDSNRIKSIKYIMEFKANLETKITREDTI